MSNPNDLYLGAAADLNPARDPNAPTKAENYRLVLVQTIAQVLTTVPDQINIKAKTAEGMGPVGRGESIEARAVCLLMR